ncbi:OmpA family protein [Spiractinospora alimapuensis]|uniref:OmpA family protein n=1 Tax=Spiractinospora alimapuensis TaxID=2820884 RepID=UPI001F1E02F3|nr:OmpA family protein [Spiractinospora alimapuensis]QVQ50529.1 OmpA family protein [Spiractinospora alimapuensis]
MVRPKSSLALLASGSLLLAGCSVGGDDEPPPVEEDYPYVREGRIFQDTGNDDEMRFAITGMERTADYTVMYYEVNYPDGFEGANRNLSMPHTLVDPLSGRVWREYTDAQALKYGSVSPNEDGLYPVHDGVTNEYRRYFPPIPEDVEQVTMIGSGLGAMTGIPIQDVDEEQPDPENPNGPQHLSLDDPPDEDSLTFENRPPDDGAEADVGWVESYVDSEVASVTREGDVETIALHSDVTFEFDESDLTDDAEDVVRDVAQTLRNSVDPVEPVITVIGHTDGIGSDSYNQTLSEERASTVRGVLEDELEDEFEYEVEGRGSTEPIAVEGGPDDEEARARNRRVEFSYKVSTETPAEEEESDDGLGVAERTVHWPAPYTDDPGDVVATAEDDGVRLDVYPLRRDGAYVIGTVTLTNTTDTPVIPDLGGDAARSGGPTQFSSGSLGGFQLLDPETELVRYVSQLTLENGRSTPFAEDVHQLQPDNTYEVVAVFPGPPMDVEELTMRAGVFGELEEIPIEN